MTGGMMLFKEQSYQDKIETALGCISSILEDVDPEDCIIAFSGGKDSTVLLELVRFLAPSMKAVFENTGVEHPETIAYCKTIPNLVELHPDQGHNFWECLALYGLPKPKNKEHNPTANCCYWLKEKPMADYIKANKVALTFTGLTSRESWQRYKLLKWLGPVYYAKSRGYVTACPLANWLEEDVWRFIKENNLPHNAIYQKGADRCGCAPCTAYKTWKEQLMKVNPKLLALILRKQKEAELGEPLGLCGEPKPHVVTDRNSNSC